MIDLSYFLFYKSYYAYDFEREELFVTEGELHTNFMADDVSERVAEFIYAILLPEYSGFH